MKLTTMRLVRMLICLAIVLAVVPMMAFAASESDSPAVLSEGEIILTDTAVVTEENLYDGVEYTWFATGSGTLTINLTDYEFGWWFNIDCGSGSESFNNKYDTVPASFSVTKGAMVTINVGAYDPEYYLKLCGADLGGECVTGSVSIELSFVESGESGGEVVTPEQPGDSQNNPKVIGSSEWLFIAPGQTMWFCYDNTENMMLNGSYSQMLNICASGDYSVSYKEMDVPVDADGYVNYEMIDMTMMGKYIFSITNNSDVEDFFSISVSDKPEYVDTYMSVELGDTTVSLDPTATYTLYEFQPEETGIYLISISEDAGVIGDWGVSYYPQDKTENKTNTLTWTCTSVGQSVMIGISGYDAEVVLTIERTGDYVPAPVIEWTFFENKELDAAKDMVYTDAEVTPIDVTDAVEDLIFKVDGLYRYGSPTGPVVVSYMDAAGLVDLYDAYYLGQLKYSVKDENGQVVARIDCNDAMLEYLDAGIIPLTEELATMLIGMGESKGWYDTEIPGFYLFDTIVDPATAYLGFCGYIEGTELPDEPVDPPVDPDDPEDPIPGTGDLGLSAVLVALMAAAAGTVVLTKKKEF